MFGRRVERQQIPEDTPKVHQQCRNVPAGLPIQRSCYLGYHRIGEGRSERSAEQSPDETTFLRRRSPFAHQVVTGGERYATGESDNDP